MPDLTRIETIHPRSYNDARRIGEDYREGVPVIMNLSELEDADAKRIIDFERVTLVLDVFSECRQRHQQHRQDQETGLHHHSTSVLPALEDTQPAGTGHSREARSACCSAIVNATLLRR